MLNALNANLTSYWKEKLFSTFPSNVKGLKHDTQALKPELKDYKNTHTPTL
jgi:hypothetical protein